MTLAKTSPPAIKSTPNLTRFMLTVLFWLFIALIGWFIVARILNIPMLWIGSWLLNWLSNGTIDHLEMSVGNDQQAGLHFVNQVIVVITNIPHLPMAESFRHLLQYDTVYVGTRPLLFGYGLPAFIALTLAVPKSLKSDGHRWVEIFIAYWVFLLVQLLGISVQALSVFIYDSPPEIAKHFPLVLAHQDILGVAKQMTTLMLPPVTPIVLWIVFNTRYMSTLVGKRLSR